MLEIDLSKIDNYINELDKLIDDYENYLNNMYYINNNIFDNIWKDNNSIKVQSNILDDNIRRKELVSKIKELRKVYKYMYDNYSKIGFSIKCNLDTRGNVLFKINNIIESLNKIYHKYNDLGDIYYYEKSDMINKQKEELVDVIKKMSTLKSKINKKYDKLIDIENNINILISKIGFVKINEIDYNMR